MEVNAKGHNPLIHQKDCIPTAKMIKQTDLAPFHCKSENARHYIILLEYALQWCMKAEDECSYIIFIKNVWLIYNQIKL